MKTTAKKTHGVADSPYNRDLRRIWAGARTLGMDSEMLHELLKALTGKESLTDTDKHDRWKLINELSSKGAFTYHPLRLRRGNLTRSASPPRSGRDRTPGSAAAMITPRQQTFIQGLWFELGERWPDFKRIEYRCGFTRQCIGREFPQTRGEASLLIEALKKRLKQV